MAFPESVKDEAKERAHYSCVWCRNTAVRLEVHHIVPDAEGGSDNLDNAVPLCPNCHSELDANPQLRTAIRKRRDWWWQKCAEEEEARPDAYADVEPILRRLDRNYEAVEQGLKPLETLKGNYLEYLQWKQDQVSSTTTLEDFETVSRTT